jgi:hypothetical protein
VVEFYNISFPTWSWRTWYDDCRLPLQTSYHTCYFLWILRSRMVIGTTHLLLCLLSVRCIWMKQQSSWIFSKATSILIVIWPSYASTCLCMLPLQSFTLSWFFNWWRCWRYLNDTAGTNAPDIWKDTSTRIFAVNAIKSMQVEIRFACKRGCRSRGYIKGFEAVNSFRISVPVTGLFSSR